MDSAESLISTKLRPPLLPARRIRRARALARLCDAGECRVVAISAGAGYGKTSLANEWAAERAAQGHASAWLSLDPADNDPARFWRYVLSALGQAGLLAAGLDGLPDEARIPALINALAAAGRPILLILDDAHLLTNPAIQADLAALVEGLPPLVQIGLVGRSAPPLPLPRWRARGWLAEISAADLRCTTAEIAELVGLAGDQALPPAVLARLESQTEGWLAGLHLALLAHRQTGRWPALAADQTLAAEYLVSDVLAAQPPELQEFLLRTAILDRMNAGACAALLDEPDAAQAQAALELLERQNVFVVGLDERRGWYRYHQLFGAALRQQLRRARPELAPLLYRQAAAWHRAQGLIAEAIGYALAGGWHADAAALIAEVGGPMLARGEWTTLLGWIDAFPPAVLAQAPALALLKAWALTITGQWEPVAAMLSDLERPSTPADLAPLPPGWRGQAAAIQAQIAAAQGQVERAIAYSEQALDLLPPEDGLMRGVIGANLGSTYAMIGRVDTARPALETALVLCQQLGNAATARAATCLLGQVAAEQGDPRRAAAHFQTVLSPARPALPHLAINAHAGMAQLYHDWNDLPLAHEHASAALALAAAVGQPELLIISHVALALVSRSQGAAAAARESLQAAAELAGQLPSSRLGGYVAAHRAELAALEGDLAAARRWERSAPTDLPPATLGLLDGIEWLALARARIALGAGERALPLLDRLSALGAATSRRRLTCAAAVLIAQIRAAAAEPLAVAALDRALSQAEPAGYIRMFVDAGPAVHALLRARAAASPAPYLAEVVAALPAPSLRPNATLAEPLTPRELDVLRLIAAGDSNRAIAERLVLTEGTVKGHVNKLLAKLEVGSRSAAAARARELGLLGEEKPNPGHTF